MRPFALLAVMVVLMLGGCATGSTPQQQSMATTGRSPESELGTNYNPDYQGGEVTGSPLDRNSSMVQ